MKNILKHIVLVLLIASIAVMSVGCYGSFNLTKKVYNWNGTMGDKWTKELVFLVLNIVPVYGVAAWIDVVILNSIEFWTGSNPVASNLTSDDGTSVAFNAEKKEMTITYAGASYIVTNENGKATVKNADGVVIAYAETGVDGSMMLKDSQGKVLSTYSQDELNTLLANK